ncbi:MAG TPA: IS110 family transposase [Candidatus Brocadiia bacterium]|nr:IS110 family transposase [Candidatus Brocadiales bacterium]
MERFIGVDLHKNMFVACFLDTAKDEKIFKSYNLRKLSEFQRDLRRDDVLAVETTTNTRYFVEKIRGCVKEVKVINTPQFKVISKSMKKTDEKDAYVIASFLSKGMVPEIRMKEKKTAELESLAHTRDKLVKLKMALKNKIHNILSSQGIITEREFLSSEKGLEKALSYKVSSVAKIELEVIVEQIRSLNVGIAKIDKELVEKGKELDGHENITSIKGVGEKSGTILLSVIGNINDFEDEKKLAAYFGMVPRVNNSNETIRHGRITKQGNKLGRTTLVQCTLVAIKYSEYLRSFYLKIKGKKGSRKAIIATAKKLSGVIYHTLKNKWVFEDFSNFVTKAAETCS